MSFRANLDATLRRLEKEYVAHNRIAVSASALLHNLDLFNSLSGQQAIPVLKGNAYGHGIELVAKALADRPLPYVAVDGYFEALRVRQVSKTPILIMGAVLPQNYARLKYDNFAFVVQDQASIHALGRTGKRINVHLECNSGMNRYGAAPQEVAQLTQLILSYKNLTLEGAMSHLADTDGPDPATINEAVAIFDACAEAILAVGATPTIFHVAQSAGSLQAQSQYANAFRLGVGLYGVNPFPAKHRRHDDLAKLQPALQLTSTITKVIDLQPGDRVSYNYTFTAPKAMRIGVLPLGYYEGVNRALSNSGVVSVGQSYAPIIGRVCMNHTMISLDGIPAKIGDEVVVYSNNPAHKNTIDNTATTHDLFNYSLLTALSPDVRRILVD